MSRFTCHVSHFTCHVSHFFFFGLKWWSLLVEGLSSTGLPCLVFFSNMMIFLWGVQSISLVIGSNGFSGILSDVDGSATVNSSRCFQAILLNLRGFGQAWLGLPATQMWDNFFFHAMDQLGRSGLVVAMSIYLCKTTHGGKGHFYGDFFGLQRTIQS